MQKYILSHDVGITRKSAILFNHPSEIVAAKGNEKLMIELPL
jgi:glycerol kinase